jgi:ubiquitin carboxyl-terminal hydrolase 7
LIVNLIIQVARDFNLVEQIGRHVYFDLVDFDKINSFRAPKRMSINEIKVDGCRYYRSK